tara:strand:+ start:1619 stop:1831 length:213 start_codon:yes stop_codon:yes gene_type:complete
MKYKRKIIFLVFIPIIFGCNYKYDGDNEVINNIIESQNYDGEITDLIIYALVTIFLFFIVGYFGIKKKNK